MFDRVLNTPNLQVLWASQISWINLLILNCCYFLCFLLVGNFPCCSPCRKSSTILDDFFFYFWNMVIELKRIFLLGNSNVFNSHNTKGIVWQVWPAPEAYLELCQTSTMEFFCKKELTANIFAKKLHCSCLTGF